MPANKKTIAGMARSYNSPVVGWARCAHHLLNRRVGTCAHPTWLVRTLDRWKKYRPALKKQMQAALQKVAAVKGLSRDVQEVVGRALG